MIATPAPTTDAAAQVPTTDKPAPALTPPVVKEFLEQLTSYEIRSLGRSLELHHFHLNDDNILDEMIDCWLRADGDVYTPSWESLVNSLEEINLYGVAEKIKRGMQIYCFGPTVWAAQITEN